MKATRKGFLIDIGHHEQEFVTAETHEHIGVMHASLHCLHGGMQRQIARMMAHGIVYKLEIIQIDNGNARENTLVPQLVFIEAAIVYTRQRIGIQKMAIAQVNFLFRSRYAQKHARVTGDTYIASRGLEAFARQMQRPILFPTALVEKLFGDHFPAFFKEQTFVAEHIALRDKAHHRIFVEQECNLLLRLRV